MELLGDASEVAVPLQKIGDKSEADPLKKNMII